jgi:hypothetical protein
MGLDREESLDRILVSSCFSEQGLVCYLYTGKVTHSLVLAVALEEDIPITDPQFYSSETLCPDSLIEHVFRAAKQSGEQIPLLQERIAVMREVGFILCSVR